MAAFEQNRLGSHSDQRVSSRLHIVGARQGTPHQQRGLIQIGRHQRDFGEQLSDQRAHRRIFNQHRSTGGHHHRVEHHKWQPVAVYGLGDRSDDLRRMQHADLDRVNADVFHHRVDLLDQHVHRNRVHRPNALGVLGSEGGDGRHAKTTQGGKSFQVGLYPCTAPAVRARNRQHPGVGLHRVASMAWHSSRAASVGSTALQMALTTAKPSAPAASSAAALLALTPPMATSGSVLA